MFGIVKYEIKKIMDIKFTIILLIILVTSMVYFTICINNSGDDYDEDNINYIVEQYGGEEVTHNPEKFRDEYIQHIEVISLEYENQQALIKGVMSREEFSKYAQMLAKAKRYDNAWSYLYSDSDIIIEKGGWIIFREYLNYFFLYGSVQPFLMVLILFIPLLLFIQDRGNGRYELLISTPNGRQNTNIAKMIVSAIISFVSLIIFFGTVVIYQYIKGNFRYLNAPIRSILIDSDMSIQEYLIVFILLVTFTYSFISMLISLVFSLLGRVLR